MSSEEKLYYIHEKFDGRVTVQSVTATLKASKVSYNSSLAVLIELDPPIVTRHKMSSLVAGKGPIKELCNNFQKGLCKYGDKCFRSRDNPSTDQEPIPGGKIQEKQREAQEKQREAPAH
jgi:Zinc finger C-x8-C-x5-C-x3-H type (and similar)